jgi:hypothetical protein
MSFRLAGLALAGALAVAGPVAPARASVCNPAFQPVCDAVLLACRTALEPLGLTCTLA